MAGRTYGEADCAFCGQVFLLRMYAGMLTRTCGKRCTQALHRREARKGAADMRKSPEAAARAKAQMQSQWKRQREESGTELGYFGQHRRVRAARGRAGDRQCVRCDEPARHWAWVHDTDRDDPENYQAMCQSCHYLYDEVNSKGTKTMGPRGRSDAAHKAWETKRRKALE